MRVMALTLIGLVGVAGCTNYQPLPPGGGGSWEEARRGLYGERAAGAGDGAPAADAEVTDAQVTDAPVTTGPRPTPPSGSPGTAAAPAAPELEPKPLPPLRTTSSAPAATTTPGRDAPVVAAAEPSAPTTDRSAPRARATTGAPATTPEPTAPAPAAEEPVAAAATPGAEADAALPPPALSGVGFLWPVPAAGEGVRVTEVGEEGALAIEAATGEAFVAAENGVVVFAGDDLEAYGRMVVVRHDGDYTTAYGHAERLDVAVGDVVRRGQQLGLIGATGGVADPQLYFEMRVGSRVVDPRAYLVEAPRLVAGG
jgi:murein DD-endopeptidase MepM/ murein hydrolase activator NlpD